jgi:hypothetical protein
VCDAQAAEARSASRLASPVAIDLATGTGTAVQLYEYSCTSTAVLLATVDLASSCTGTVRTLVHTRTVLPVAIMRSSLVDLTKYTTVYSCR